MKKLISILVAFAMMAMLSITAFAANPADGTGEKAAPAQSYLVKYLELGKTVTNPNVGFQFTFADAGNTANLSANPVIDPAYIAPASATAATADGDSVYDALPFSTILAGAEFTKAGVYTYTVSETQNKVYAYDATEETWAETTAPAGYTFDWDDQTYTVRIYVDATNTVQWVTATKTGENGKEIITTQDPVVQEGTDLTIEGLTFDNKATKTEDVTPDIPNDIYGVLNLKKAVDTVSGSALDAARANDTFTFELTLTRAYGDETALPAAKVVKAGAAASTATAYTPALDYGTNTVTLGIDDILYFDTLPAGVTWKVEEKLTSQTGDQYKQYAPAYVVTSASLTEDARDDAPAFTNLATDSYLLEEGTAGEKAVYTNTYDDKLDNPEGILMSNLPYIVLALVAIGGLVAYVVVRRRNADEA